MNPNVTTFAFTLFNKFVKPILFRATPNQRTDMHDNTHVYMPPPPGTQNKFLRDENSQSQIVPPLVLSPFPQVPAAAA